MLSQKWVTLIVVVVAAIVIGGEYAIVHWYPYHKQRMGEAALKLLPYENTGLGVQMEVAAGIYGKVQDFAGGVRIYRSRLRGRDPSIVITSEPNPSGGSNFSDEYLSQLETAAENNGPSFQRVTLNGWDAVIIAQFDSKSKTTNITARVVVPNRIIQAVCNTGGGNQQLYTEACNDSLATIKASGPPSAIHERLDSATN